MQLLIAIELALMLVLILKVGIRNIERELGRKPIRYDDMGYDASAGRDHA